MDFWVVNKSTIKYVCFLNYQMWKSCNHENILSLEEIVTDSEDRRILLFENFYGETLQYLIESKGKIDDKIVKKVFYQVN